LAIRAVADAQFSIELRPKTLPIGIFIDDEAQVRVSLGAFAIEKARVMAPS